jgi:DNA adenine methylase
MEIKRPIVRYHGGKFLLADWIISYFPEHKGYIEPFGGGASVLLKKPRSYFEVYNDLDDEIVNVFRVVRDNGAELLRRLELTPFSRVEYRNTFCMEDKDPVERARRSVFRSFAGFGSAAMSKPGTGFRSNSNRSGTTPAIDWRNYPEHISNFIERLRGVIIENKSYESVIKQHDAGGVLIYADPPYVHETRSKDKPDEYKFEMTNEEHEILLERLKSAIGFVIISAYETDLYNDILKGWHKEKKTIKISGKERTEILYISPNCPKPTTYKSNTLFD